ncbi:MAG: Na(+)/H(+) antiporter NhaA [Acidimicrobiales bacterium]|nr:MAG: Na(+)/H(+) antiporter NhaA [Acidimicrobiales bacterium]
MSSRDPESHATDLSRPVPDAEDYPELSPRWTESDKFVPRTFIRPILAFIQYEAAGAFVMLIAAACALVMANSPLQDAYEALRETRLDVTLGDLVHLDLTLVEWVNDALMTVFFFVVAMEIKREVTQGELADPRRAALPVIAAAGGMLLPACIYLLFNSGTSTAGGWGVPVATDIAFAVGVVTLLGNRVPSAAKIFLLTLAVADDVGGILVIAVFYSSDLKIGWLALVTIPVLLVLLLRRTGVRSVSPYVLLGAVTWFAMHESGLHATLTGVLFGLLTPAWSYANPKFFGLHATELVDRIQRRFDEGLTEVEHEENEADLAELTRLARDCTSPLNTLIFKLEPWVAFAIVPAFAFLNSGVVFTRESLRSALTSEVVWGIGLGLLLGKAVGIFGATWLAVKSGVGRLPRGVTWGMFTGVAAAGGIGFTVALFVANLAFSDPNVVDQAKVGIFAGSLLSGVVAYSLLRVATRNVSTAAGAVATAEVT